MKSRTIGMGLIIGACLLSMSLNAYAENPHQDPADPSAVAQAGSAAIAGAAAVSGSRSGAAAGVESAIEVAPVIDTSLVGGDSSAKSKSEANGTQLTSVDASSVYERSVGTLIMGTVIPVDCGFGGQAGGADRNGSGFLGASWTTDRCYTLKVANAWAAMGQYEYACEMLMDVSRRAMKRRGIVNVDCAIVGAQLKAQHAMPAVTKSEMVQSAPPAGSSNNYVTQEQLDRAFKQSMSK